MTKKEILSIIKGKEIKVLCANVVLNNKNYIVVELDAKQEKILICEIELSEEKDFEALWDESEKILYVGIYNIKEIL